MSNIVLWLKHITKLLWTKSGSITDNKVIINKREEFYIIILVSYWPEKKSIKSILNSRLELLNDDPNSYLTN